METRANHILIGAFTLVVLAGAMLFALWIGKATLEREWNWYLVEFGEAVSGLTVGGAVQYNGIQIGEVRELELDPQDPSRVLATIRVVASTPIKTDTVATLAFTGLTGVSLIQLSGGTPEAPLLLPPADGSLPLIRAETSALQKLLASSEDIATTASKAMLRVNELLSKENVERIARTLENLDNTTGALADSRTEIRTLLSEAAAAGTRLNRTLEGAEKLVARLDRSAATLDSDVIAELPATMEQLQDAIAKLDRFAGNADQLLIDNRDAVSQFSQQGLAQVGPALHDLRRLLRDLNRITDELEKNPADFLLGGQPVPEFEP